MISVKNVFLNGQAGPRDGLGGSGTTIPTSRFYLPVVPGRNTVDTVYKILVQQIDGSPSAATLTMRFEAGMSTTGGNLTPAAGIGEYQNSGTGTRWYYTDLRPQWQVLDGEAHRTLLPDGDFPSVVAGLSSSFPLLYVKRILGGFDHRLSINVAYTGGTNPAFRMSIEAETRYDK